MQAKTEYVDQMVKEILADISRRETNPSPKQTGASVAEMEDAFDMIFHDEDELSKAVMRKILKELL
ncbi:hypothetical protein [Desulfosarcina ovata]|uniref:Uncharacterized protein n=1 Tax=Desulfosarcina ovata subsp. ovata TaxID=2752305 RepID=A0A5K8A3S3_9BACT|nr:hypothetical protein [Desulfosarcina ovata]BBO87097.1 hypothetical protein DSCOOX_02770 [Desulfosarcina ovata subsp. ovata]